MAKIDKVKAFIIISGAIVFGLSLADLYAHSQGAHAHDSAHSSNTHDQ